MYKETGNRFVVAWGREGIGINSKWHEGSYGGNGNILKLIYVGMAASLGKFAKNSSNRILEMSELYNVLNLIQ